MYSVTSIRFRSTLVQSVDGIRSRVNRHLASARSDMIGNRQIDVWRSHGFGPIRVKDKAEISPLEDALFHEFSRTIHVDDGNAPKPRANQFNPTDPSQKVQVMSEIAEKKDLPLRLPRSSAAGRTL
jgi:hypothetical protein